MSGVAKLGLRWFPGRYGMHYAEAGSLQLSVGFGVGGAEDNAWICRAPSVGIEETFRGPHRHAAMAHLEGLVRDRLIKALAAFGDQEKTP